MGCRSTIHLNIELIGAYKNIRLKPRFIEDGGFLGGPLLLGRCATISAGRNFLSGYPYFTDWGTKLLYARIAYGFPIFKRISSRFINFNFSKLYAELFAEAGVVGNFSRFEGHRHSGRASDGGLGLTPTDS